MTRKALTLGAIGIGCCAVALVLGSSDGAGSGEFTMVEEIRHRRDDGVEVREVLVHMVRRDGATMSMRRELGGEEIGNRVVIDPSRKARIVIEPRAEAVTTYPLTDSEIRQLLEVPPRCGAPEGAPTSFRHGYPVYRVERRMDMQDGTTLLTEKWLAPDLRCLVLEGKAKLIENGVELASNERTVLSVEIGKVDYGLFEIPSHYLEMSPSEVMAEVARRTGRECRGCQEGAGHLDEVYWSYQKRKQ